MPILAMKLHLPTSRRQLVPRPRLTEQLLADPRSMPRLVLIAAPAGFGKTTVLTQWLTTPEPKNAHSGAVGPSRRTAWLSLDQDDSDPGRFLAHVIAALQTTNADIGADALALMDNDRDLMTEDVLVSLLNDLDTIAAPTVLVLDDYHVVDAPAVHEAVAFLLDNLPGQVTLAIDDPRGPAAGASRLRARGQLVEVRAADLRFTEDEAGRFLNDVMGLGLDGAQVTALEARTEGWAAGLQLAALSAAGRPAVGGGGAGDGIERFVAEFTGSHRFVLDYLVEEVLDTQPDGIRDASSSTPACLDELTAGLCDAVTGRTDGQQTLETLERSNLFLIPLDDERRWCRYHHLFADALRAQRSASDPARVLRGCIGSPPAGTPEQGRLADAVAHALAADDDEQAADLVELVHSGHPQAPGRPRPARLAPTRSRTSWSAADRCLPHSERWVRLSEGDLDGGRCLDRCGATRPGRAARPNGPAAAAPGPWERGGTTRGRRQRWRPRDATASRTLRVLPATIEVYRASIAQGAGRPRRHHPARQARRRARRPRGPSVPQRRRRLPGSGRLGRR